MSQVKFQELIPDKLYRYTAHFHPTLIGFYHLHPSVLLGYGGQALLDEFVEIRVGKGEEEIDRGEEAVGEGVEKVETVTRVGEVKKSEKMSVIADLKDPEHRSRCPYCGEWVGRHHGRSIYLYTKHGRIHALADMNHIHNNRKYGLMENIRFLYWKLEGF